MNPENMPIFGWARPIAVATSKYCAVVEVHTSICTSCRGRWSVLEPTHYLEGRDRDQDDDGNKLTKCETCDAIARAQAVDITVDSSPSRGTSSATPHGQTSPDWDLGDLGGDS